jgi:hypothetical protein
MLFSSKKSGLRLCDGRGAIGFGERSLGGVAKGSGSDGSWVVGGKLEILIQILHECGVILLATQNVGEQKLNLCGFGRLAERITHALLGLLQAVQGEQRPAQEIMTRPGRGVQIQTLADDCLGLGKFLPGVEDGSQSQQRVRILSPAQVNGLPKGLLCVLDAPQIQVGHSHLVVGLVEAAKFRDRALKLRQAPRGVFFCQEFEALLEGVKGLAWNGQFPDGNYVVRFRGLRARQERQTQAGGQ